MTTAIATPVRLCREEEIAPGMGRAFDVAGRSIAVFRSRAGSFHALDNACPHSGGPLADGLLAGNCVVCPLHAYKVNLATGACSGHALPDARTYPVTIRDGWILVEVSPL